MVVKSALLCATSCQAPARSRHWMVAGVTVLTRSSGCAGRRHSKDGACVAKRHAPSTLLSALLLLLLVASWRAVLPACAPAGR